MQIQILLFKLHIVCKLIVSLFQMWIRISEALRMYNLASPTSSVASILAWGGLSPPPKFFWSIIHRGKAKEKRRKKRKFSVKFIKNHKFYTSFYLKTSKNFKISHFYLKIYCKISKISRASGGTPQYVCHFLFRAPSETKSLATPLYTRMKFRERSGRRVV